MAENLLPHATARPDAPALVDDVGTTTWSQLDERVNRLVHAMREAGVGAGDVVAAMLPNRREYYEVFGAAAHAGFLVVPVNWHWVADELSYVLENATPKALFVDERYADVALAALAANAEQGRHVPPLVIAVGGAVAGATPYEDVLASGSPAEPAEQLMGGPMFYTSGTTGRPKGVRSTTYANTLPAGIMGFMSAGFSASMGCPLPGVTLLDGPLYHSAQWAFSLLPLMGGSTVVMRHKFDPAETLRAIDAHGVTNVHLVPTQFIRLLKLPDDVRAGFDGSSLQIVWHGAAPCPLEVKRQMIEWWGPKITEYYGGTEAGIVSLASSEDWLAKPGTLGKPLATAEVMVVGDDGEPVEAGQSGTLYFRNTMGTDFEYHGDPEKTEKAHLRPGVFTLGDVGCLDDDGWLFMSDRKIDMIISGGVNIYPAEIEGVLVNHPAVHDAAVFGIPDEEFGEQVKAAVELADGYEASPEMEAELIGFCREHLAGYKVPRSIDVEDALPRHPTGKLYKRLLRDKYWESSGRAI